MRILRDNILKMRVYEHRSRMNTPAPKNPSAATKDNVNSPSHYTNGKIECINAIESATVGKNGLEAVCVANVIKYLWRYEDKNGVEDIKKAYWYLDRLVKTVEGKADA